jgi:hypothetical protein
LLSDLGFRLLHTHKLLAKVDSPVFLLLLEVVDCNTMYLSLDTASENLHSETEAFSEKPQRDLRRLKVFVPCGALSESQGIEAVAGRP